MSAELVIKISEESASQQAPQSPPPPAPSPPASSIPRQPAQQPPAPPVQAPLPPPPRPAPPPAQTVTQPPPKMPEPPKPAPQAAAPPKMLEATKPTERREQTATIQPEQKAQSFWEGGTDLFKKRMLGLDLKSDVETGKLGWDDLSAEQKSTAMKGMGISQPDQREQPKPDQTGPKPEEKPAEQREPAKPIEKPAEPPAQVAPPEPKQPPPATPPEMLTREEYAAQEKKYGKADMDADKAAGKVVIKEEQPPPKKLESQKQSPPAEKREPSAPAAQQATAGPMVMSRKEYLDAEAIYGKGEMEKMKAEGHFVMEGEKTEQHPEGAPRREIQEKATERHAKREEAQQVEQAMREQKPQYGTQQEEKEEQHRMVQARLAQRLAVEKMTEEERIEFEAQEQAKKQAIRDAIKARTAEIRPPEPKEELSAKDEAAERLSRADRERDIEKAMRAQSPEYNAEQEELEEKRKLVKARQAEREAVEKMTTEERVDYEANRLAENLDERKAVKERLAEIRPPEPKEEKEPISVEEEASKKLERESRQADVEKEMRSQNPVYRAQGELKDAYEENALAIREMTEAARVEKIQLARMTEEERIDYLGRKEAQRQREANAVKAKADEVLGKDTGEKAFDPYAEAGKSREAKIKKEQVKAAYEEKYGDGKKGKSAFDVGLDMAQQMRGTLGGIFGPLAGAALDVATAVRNAKPKEKSPERREAERLNKLAKIPFAIEVPEAKEAEKPAEKAESVEAKEAPPKKPVPEAKEGEEPAEKPADKREPTPMPTKTAPKEGLPPRNEPDSWALESTQQHVLAAIQSIGPERPTHPQDNASRNDTAEKQPTEPAKSVEKPAADEEKEWWPPEKTPRTNSPTNEASRDEPAPTKEPATRPSTEKTPSPPREAPVATAAEGGGEAAGGAEAAGAAGMEAMAAAAAGPLAVVVEVMAAMKVLKEATMSQVRAVGETVSSLATFKDGSARVAEMGEGMKGFSDKIFYLNPVLGIFAGVAGEATSQVAKLDDAVKSTADRLAQYNPELAGQKAQQEVAEMMRDMRRANSVGDQAASANASRFTMEQKMADITDRFAPMMLAISEKVFDVVTAILEIIEVGVKAGVQSTEILVQILEYTPGVALANKLGVINTTEIKKLLQQAKEDNKSNESDAIWNQFMGMTTQVGWNQISGQSVNPMGGAPGPALQRP